VIYAISVREGMTDAVKVGVGVGMYSEISTAVRAAAVLIGLEKAELTTSRAPKPGSDVPGLARAAAETMQIRLNPRTPAARTVKGAEYSRIFTLVSLNLRRMKDAFVPVAEKHARNGRKVLSYKYSTVRNPDFTQV
jgi:hypothetical protein